MGQWLNVQVLLLDFMLQSISCSPFRSLGFAGAYDHLTLRCTPRDRLKWGLRTLRPQSLLQPRTARGESRESARAPRRSQVLGRRTRPGSTPSRAWAPLAPLRFPCGPPDPKAALRPLRRRGCVHERIGTLSNSRPPTPHGPRWPLAGKYFTIY